MRVTFDTESLPLEHSHPRPIFACVAVAVDGAPARAVPQSEALRLLDAADVVVAHRAPFDVEALGWKPGAQRIRNTSIRGVLIGAANGQHAAASSGLRELARSLLGITLGGKGSTQLSFRPGVPLTPEQERYVCADVDATDAVFLRQGGDVDVSPAEGWQTARAFDVWRMRERGIRLDVPRVQALLKEGNERRDALRRPLVDAGIIQPRGPKKDPWRDSSVDQGVVQARLRAAGVTAKPKRRATDERPESGLLSAEGDVLRATEDPALVALAEYKDAEKWVSFVEAFDVGPVVRPFWQPCVASGRISASRPNVTQIPKGELRACVIPSEGNVLVVADYSLLEFRCWADVCQRWLGWSTAAEAFQQGEDPHVILARELGGDRQAAKAGNYGFVGGMGPRRAAETYGITEERAEEIRTAWRRTWPEWRAYFRRIEAGREGERYRVKLPWSGRERLAFYSEAANFVIQGTGSDVAKEALRRATAAGLPVTMLIHDEIVLDVPRTEARDAAEALKEAMEAAGREVAPNVPWKQDVKVVERWA